MTTAWWHWGGAPPAPPSPSPHPPPVRPPGRLYDSERVQSLQVSHHYIAVDFLEESKREKGRALGTPRETLSGVCCEESRKKKGLGFWMGLGQSDVGKSE